MAEEKKIRIKACKEVEQMLLSKGAVFEREASVTDTYFRQQKGHVLKVTEEEQGAFEVELKADRGGFAIVRYEKVEDAEERKEELAEEFGIKRVLKKRRRFFAYKEYTININLIEDVGEFLIVEGERVPESVITEELGFPDPTWITVPFSEL